MSLITAKYDVDLKCDGCGRRYGFNFTTEAEVAKINEEGWACPHCGHTRRNPGEKR